MRPSTLLLLANVGAFFFTVGSGLTIRPDVAHEFGLSLPNLEKNPMCLITYMFLHANLLHLAMNMLGLVTFGRALEEILSRFEWYLVYFASGVAGGLLQIAFTPFEPVVGASAAIFGLIGCMTMLRPLSIIFFFLIPVPLALFAVLYTLFVVLLVKWGLVTNVAHVGHLGGMGTGAMLALVMRPMMALRGLAVVTVMAALVWLVLKFVHP